MLYTRFGVWFQAVGPLVPFSTTYSTAPIYSHYPHPTMLPTDCVPVCQSVPVATESIHQVSVHRKFPACNSSYQNLIWKQHATLPLTCCLCFVSFVFIAFLGNNGCSTMLVTWFQHVSVLLRNIALTLVSHVALTLVSHVALTLVSHIALTLVSHVALTIVSHVALTLVSHVALTLVSHVALTIVIHVALTCQSHCIDSCQSRCIDSCQSCCIDSCQSHCIDSCQSHCIDSCQSCCIVL